MRSVHLGPVRYWTIGLASSGLFKWARRLLFYPLQTLYWLQNGTKVIAIKLFIIPYIWCILIFICDKIILINFINNITNTIKESCYDTHIDQFSKYE